MHWLLSGVSCVKVSVFSWRSVTPLIYQLEDGDHRFLLPFGSNTHTMSDTQNIFRSLPRNPNKISHYCAQYCDSRLHNKTLLSVYTEKILSHHQNLLSSHFADHIFSVKLSMRSYAERILNTYTHIKLSLNSWTLFQSLIFR